MSSASFLHFFNDISFVVISDLNSIRYPYARRKLYSFISQRNYHYPIRLLDLGFSCLNVSISIEFLPMMANAYCSYGIQFNLLINLFSS